MKFKITVMKPVKRKNAKTIGIELETLFQTSYLENEANDSLPSVSNGSMVDLDDYNDDNDDRSGEANVRNTPGHIPAEAKRILDKWMFEHRYYCYPSKLEKQQLSLATNLSVQRISNWFVNSRRRSLPKMIENDGKNVNDFIITRKRQQESRQSLRIMAESKEQHHLYVDLKANVADDYEFTLTGERVLKEPPTNEANVTNFSSDNGACEIITSIIPDSANIMTGGDASAKPMQHAVMTDETVLAECTQKTCITGIIDDQTTNIKYLYILVQPAQ